MCLSTMSFTTSLGGTTSTYQWLKYNTTSQLYVAINSVAARNQVYQKIFTTSDSGRYSVTISNPDFAGLQFYRRAIHITTCEVSYKTGFIVKKPVLDKCFGLDTLVVSFLNSNNTQVASYSSSWYFNNHVVSNNTNNRIAVYATGNYSYLTYDSLSGCSVLSKDTLINSQEDRATSTLRIQFNVSDSSIVDLSSYIPVNTPTFQWTVDGLPIAGATKQKLRLYYNGNYRLITINKDGCSVMSNLLVVTSFSKTFIRAEHQLNVNGQVVLNAEDFNVVIYPNPASTSFTISGLPEGSKVSISTPQGGLVFETYVQRNELYVDAKNLSSGMYFVETWINGLRLLRKIVIE
jgi:hypothetical protein